MDNHQIDQWAREELKEREITPGPMVWDRLEAELEKEKSVSDRPRWRVIFWITGLFLVCIAWIGFQSYGLKKETLAQTKHKFSDTVNEDSFESAKVKKPDLPDANEAEAVPGKTEKPVERPLDAKERKLIQKKPSGLIPQGLESRPVHIQTEKIKIQEATPPVALQENATDNTEILTETKPVVPATMQTIEKHRTKVDAGKLLAEANQEMDKTTRKYHIDPRSLLNEAEKENHNRFLQKVFKTVTETSTSVYASVASRNVEP